MTDSLKNLAGEMVLADWPKEGLDVIWPVLRQHPLGGFIFHSRDIKSPQWLRAVAEELWAYYNDQGWLPPWLAVTEEGGTVQRMRPWFNPPSAMSLGARDEVMLSRETGRLVGQFLLASGVNWNFAPVVDVVTEKKSHVIGTRSFGSDPDVVARHSVAWLQGQQEAGVMATAKHFPGHGMTARDSHLERPVVGMAERDRDLHLEPYRHAIAAGVGSVMTAHIAYPQYDARPATLSPYWIRRVLREELGFDGLIVTDALSMKGIAESLAPEAAAVAALEAGVDVMDCGGSFQQAMAIYQALQDYLERCATGRGGVSLEELAAVYQRISSAKQKILPPESWPDWPDARAWKPIYASLAPKELTVSRSFGGNDLPLTEVWASGSRPTAVEEDGTRRPDILWLNAGNPVAWDQQLSQIQSARGPVVLYAENLWKHPELARRLRVSLKDRHLKVIAVADPVDADLFPDAPSIKLYGNREMAHEVMVTSSGHERSIP